MNASDSPTSVPAEPPAKAADTTPEQPWPLRLFSQRMSEYLAKAPETWVEGQIVQITRRPGTYYSFLNLRDVDADVSFSVMLPTRQLDSMQTPPTEGSRVVALVKAKLYAARGSLSLEAKEIRPVGIGALLAQIENLKRALASEGLFAPERKLPLPFLPRKVGLICGRASAAEKDVVENAGLRWPGVRFDIRAVAVQGAHAVNEVIAALDALEAEAKTNPADAVDVIVIARGGGSFEDLLAFSNETLIRRVAERRIPIVSAIGHDVDQPLLDYVADVRASTPTDAASKIVPDFAEETALIQAGRERIRTAMRTQVQRDRDLVLQARATMRSALGHRVRLAGQEVGSLRQQLGQHRRHKLDQARREVGHLRQQLAALSPRATMKRGYAVVSNPAGVITDAAELKAGDDVQLHFAIGSAAATITATQKESR